MFRDAKEKSNEVRLDSKTSDFIPFACHYDGSTILTKNGELVQTVKIQSISDDKTSLKDFAENLSHLRETVRKAIAASIKSDNFAVWFHTMRSRQDISLDKVQYPDIFSDYINKAWRRKNIWDKRFANEFYITVLYEGQALSVRSLKDMFLSLTFSAQRKYRNNYLKKAHRDLNEAVNNLILELKGYNAIKLEVYEEDGVFYSAPLEFFSKIVNLDSKKVVLEEYDISQILAENKISFGFNALEIEEDGKHKFATIFSIKEYTDIAAKSVEELFSLPLELVITEAADFINSGLALKDYEYQKYILDVSRSDDFYQISGLNTIYAIDAEKPTSFAERQVTITMVENSLARLEKEAKSLLSTLSALGIVIVREDLMMEDCFWSQLPGNFAFLRRKFKVPSNTLAAFTSVDNSPIGSRSNPWGGAVTILPAADKTPYFFNFHDQEKSHAIFMGAREGRRNRLVNFLLAESEKYKPQIFHITRNINSEVFIKALGGKLFTQDKLKLNPFNLADNPKNRSFINQLLELMLTLGTAKLSEGQKNALLQITASIFSLPPEQRNLQNIAPLLADSPLASHIDNFNLWLGAGLYANVFSSSDNLVLAGRINGFVLGEMEDISAAAVQLYLLHRIEEELKTRPSLIVLNETFEFLGIKAFSPQEWLNNIRDKNGNVIFSTKDLHIFSKYQSLAESIPETATTVFLPHPDYNAKIAEAFNLTPEAFQMIKSLEIKKKVLGIMHAGTLHMVKFSIAELKDIAAILSATQERIHLMEKTIMQTGEETNKWLPSFIKKVV